MISKKLISLLIASVLVSSTLFTNTAYAERISKNDLRNKEEHLVLDAYSDRFKDAYIEQEYYDFSNCNIEVKNGALYSDTKDSKIKSHINEINESPDFVDTINSYVDKETSLMGVAIVRTYFEESFKNEDGESICVDSRLLTKDEVISTKEEISTMSLSENPISSTKGKLELRLAVFDGSASSGIEYIVSGNAYWSNYGSNNAATSGEDLISFLWGGGYDYSNQGIYITSNQYSSGGYDFNSLAYLADQAPNSALVWMFPEYKVSLGTVYYAKQVTIGTHLYKNTLTGNGNTTGVVLKYIHTYDDKKANVKLNVSAANGGTVASTVSIDNITKQWALTVSITGLIY